MKAVEGCARPRLAERIYLQSRGERVFPLDRVAMTPALMEEMVERHPRQERPQVVPVLETPPLQAVTLKHVEDFKLIGRPARRLDAGT